MRTNRYTSLGKMLNEHEFLAASPSPALEVPHKTDRTWEGGLVSVSWVVLGGGSGQGRAGESLERCYFFLSTPSRAGGAGVGCDGVSIGSNTLETLQYPLKLETQLSSDPVVPLVHIREK